jgi:hypothetical protein
VPYFQRFYLLSLRHDFALHSGDEIAWDVWDSGGIAQVFLMDGDEWSRSRPSRFTLAGKGGKSPPIPI